MNAIFYLISCCKRNLMKILALMTFVWSFAIQYHNINTISNKVIPRLKNKLCEKE